MQPILSRLQAGEVLVGDGGLGTLFFDRGLKPGESPEKINLDNPELVEEIYSSYLTAGSDLITTNTFGGSPLKLAQHSLDDEIERINATAARIARKVAGTKTYVAACIGPCGRLLEPYGDVSPQEVYESFERQIRAIVPENPDIILVETMTDLREATLAIKAARTIAPSLPVSASMTYNVTPNGFFTFMGVSVEQAAIGLAEAGADIIGSNCGNGIENMVLIATEYTKHTHLPLIIQSNAGLPTMKGDKAVYPETPEFMADKCRQLLKLGVRIIGGCCGTTPEHIAAIRAIVKQENRL
jgi:5-methyltetrahydrofolate--homocysteine methyltransferase